MPAPKGNKFALGCTTNGQAPKYESPTVLMRKIGEYFDSLNIYDNNKKLQGRSVSTITDLCLYLGFSSRQSFYDYEKREDFSYIIKRARMVYRE